MRKKTIYIHIGPPKTGSTFIQNCLLYANQSDDCEILYPKAGRFAVGEEFKRLHDGKTYYGKGQLDTHVGILWGLNDKLKSHSIEGLLEELKHECANSDKHTIVLSCEGFVFLSKEKVLTLVEHLNPHEIRVVFVDRNAYERMQSAYCQRIKMGTETDDFATFLNNTKVPISWNEVIRKQWDIPDITEIKRIEFKNGSELIADFFSYIGLAEQITELNQQAKRFRKNARLDDCILRLMLNINRLQSWNSGSIDSRLILLSCMKFKRLLARNDSFRTFVTTFARLFIRDPIISDSDREKLKQLTDLNNHA